MHPTQRPSPRTASAANNLQTNPTRTNNQRDPTSERSSPYSDAAFDGYRGVDDGDGEMVTRAEQAAETEQKNSQKVNQVIQVRTAVACLTEVAHLANVLPQEFLYQSSTYHCLLPHDPSSGLQQQRRAKAE